MKIRKKKSLNIDGINMTKNDNNGNTPRRDKSIRHSITEECAKSARSQKEEEFITRNREARGMGKITTVQRKY